VTEEELQQAEEAENQEAEKQQEAENQEALLRLQQGMEGILEKKGHMVNSWKSRHVVWNPRKKNLMYYVGNPSKGTFKPKGQLSDINRIFDIPDRAGKRAFRFDVVNASEHRLELCAGTKLRSLDTAVCVCVCVCVCVMLR
jgi:hypothetical protein